MPEVSIDYKRENVSSRCNCQSYSSHGPNMFRNDYNENEGITPTIDIENEEMSDDIDGNEVLGESYIDDYEVNEEMKKLMRKKIVMALVMV